MRLVLFVTVVVLLLACVLALSLYFGHSFSSSYPSRSLQSRDPRKILNMVKTCPEAYISDPLQDALASLQISTFMTRINEDTLLVPCGYTLVESEMAYSSAARIVQCGYFFALDGCDELVSKDLLWKRLVSSYGEKGASNMMPMTLILTNLTGRNRAINHIIESETQAPAIILKKNIQRKEGLFLSDSPTLLIEKIRSKKFVVAQKFLRNALQIRGHKLNLRFYILGIRERYSDKTDFYLHEYGKCVYANKAHHQTRSKPLDVTTNITSSEMNVELYQILPQTIQQLTGFLKTDSFLGIVRSRLVDILKPFSAHLGSNKKFAHVKLFQLFGADIILLENSLQPMLLEFNKGPSMQPVNEVDSFMKTEIYKDTLRCAENSSTQGTRYLRIV